MPDYKPTFKVSPKRRPLVQRLTPLAWALIGLVALVTVLGLAAAGMVLAGRASPDEPWWTPTATVPPTATLPQPSPTPTESWKGVVSPTAVISATPAFPAWWSDQMTQDEDGDWWPPEEVTEMVREHHVENREAYAALFSPGVPPDPEAFEELLRRWNSGPALEPALEALGDESSTPVVDLWEVCLPQVQEFSSDGMECTLGWVCQNGTYSVYDQRTGELLRSVEAENSGLYLFRMHYDPTDGWWKVFEVLDYIPPLE